MRKSLTLVAWAALTIAGCTEAPRPDASDAAEASSPDADAVSDIIASDAMDAHEVGMDAVDVAPPPRHVATALNRRFETATHLLAAVEMQQSGEPLAEAMGRDLGGYDRNAREPDLYVSPESDGGAVRDPGGYSIAVESYEYSKYQMNAVAFESSPGTSLAFGPVTNPAGLTGRAAHDLLRDIVQRMAIASHAGVRAPAGSDAGMAPVGFVTVPAPDPVDNPLNTLGFGGLWPVMHPFRSWDPTIRASGNAARGCSLTGGYGASAGMAIPVGDYECGYSTLHLVSRADQVERVITPGASGFAAWKFAFWIINYLQILHDSEGNVITGVAEEDLERVGIEGNTVVGTREDGSAGVPGTWLGSGDLEGFQAGVMIQMLQDQAEHIVRALTTSDGATLSGFANLREALDYDHASTLRYVPAEIEVTETPDPEARFPRPSYALRDARSRLMDVLGLLAGSTELYALTDRGNVDVGFSRSTRAWFDGDPFPADEGLPDGDPTPHDRWLALAKVALVNLDRMHRTQGDLLVDTATFAGGAATPGTTVRIESTAYALVVLRSARRALSSNLTLYSSGSPDRAVISTALDATSWRSPPEGETIAQRLTRLIRAQAELLYDRLTDDTGRAAAGWDIAAGRATAVEGDLAAHAAAIRGLLEASLALGDPRYRERARAVFERMDSVFYDARSRSYRTSVSGERVWTPERFGLMTGALRELFILIGLRPGEAGFGALVAGRLQRLNKLVLNGWDDANEDGVVQWPEECVRVEGGLPRGGLQLAERALTGELGIEGGAFTSDRDHDCVPEIDDAFSTATLASELRFDVR